MSEMRAILIDTAARLFADLCTDECFEKAEKGTLDEGAWKAIEASGLTRATVPEAIGGDGADLGDALGVVREAGRFALPLPLADTLLAQLVLASAGMRPQAGVGTIGPVAKPRAKDGVAMGDLTLARSGAQWSLSGTLYRVPTARHASFLTAVAQCEDSHAIVLVPGACLRQAIVREDVNWANEPRDTLSFHETMLPVECVGGIGRGLAAEDLAFHGASFRVAAMSGAMARVLELTVRYAKERTQFGKPIGQFQAIQHGLAMLASQVAAANAAADATIDAVSRGPARFEIAAAKARVGEAAHVASSIAHQVHGAMGFTHEHALHRSTRRLWAWRDEFGTETEWAEWIGRIAVHLGGSGLWPFLASTDRQVPIPAPRG